ncbi:probable inactive 1-aminocyclopropane-1-carboxylate synthase-like protein 2 [Exaiptasia diaphana]|uniref:Aminotransferase class I/classII large domain-containing protein n=1 Tax=Exaiptasia diaphana TaxID=2652724 RepID=A0A913YY39_EXADI|nr:probable inactive 1-aminocyclopropane-1-carboxylate synthase-like protein 2 [Exaiptasia diaphana]
MSMISKRGQRIANNSSILSDVWERLLLDGYHKTDNPQGIINLGTSENKLMYDILKPKFQEPASREIQEHHTQYCDFRGTYEFRKAVAEFLDHYMKPLENIDPDNLCVINGCNAIVEAMGTVLADPGEGFLLPTPYYGGFQIDLKQRAEVVPFPVYLTNKPVRGETGPFQLSVYRLEKAMDEAKKQNIKIRALLLCNPNNPFGYIYSEKLLQDFLEFAQRNSLHVIIDEIYLLSIFKKEYSMKSMLALNNLPDKQYVHVIWGFSKDFGISGFRCGVLHTWNKEVLGALWWISYFQCVPTSTQCLLLNLINDRVNDERSIRSRCRNDFVEVVLR